MSVADIMLISALAYLALLSLYNLLLLLASRFKGSVGPENELNGGSFYVSIIVPTRNEPPEIMGELFSNLSSLGYDGYEVIVVDDSDDEMARKLVEHAKIHLGKIPIKVIHRESRRGFKPGALNAALPAAKGDVVVVLDADSRIDRGFIASLSRVLNARADLSYVQARTLAYVHSIASLAYFFFIEYRNRVLLPGTGALGNPLIAGYGYAIKRSALEEVGGWNEECLAEDIDLTLKLMGSSKRGSFLEHVVVREHPPATVSDLVSQQERWMYGTYQALKAVGSYLGRQVPTWSRVAFIMLPLMFTGLIPNVVIAGIPFVSFLTRSSLSTFAFAAATSVVNVLAIPVLLAIAMGMKKQLGIKRTIAGILLGAIVYNYLSLRSLLFLVEALTGRRRGWRVTGKSLGRRRRRGPGPYDVACLLYYFLSMIISFVSKSPLTLWIGGLFASHVAVAYIRIRGW